MHTHNAPIANYVITNSMYLLIAYPSTPFSLPQVDVTLYVNINV